MTTQRPERRARTVALAGLGFQILLSVFFAILWSWGQTEALRALMLLSAIGNIVWLFLVLACQQRVLVQEEKFETEQLQRERAAAGGTVTDGTLSMEVPKGRPSSNRIRKPALARSPTAPARSQSLRLAR